MRTTHTYILRLLVDTDEPDALRGTVRAVTEDEEHAFTDGEALLAWLRRMGAAPDTDGGQETDG